MPQKLFHIILVYCNFNHAKIISQLVIEVDNK
jgi:hypothetical protein